MNSKESEQEYFEDDIDCYSNVKNLYNHSKKKNSKDNLKFSDTWSSSLSYKSPHSRDFKNRKDKILVREERKEIGSLIKNDTPKKDDLDYDGYGQTLKLNQRKNQKNLEYKEYRSLYRRDLATKYRVSPRRIDNLYNCSFFNSTKYPHINNNKDDNSIILLPKNQIKKLVDEYKNSNHVNINNEILEKIDSYTKNINQFISVNNEVYLYVQEETNGIKIFKKEYTSVNKDNIEKIWSFDEDDEYASVIGRTKDYCFHIIHDKLADKSVFYYSKGLYDLIYRDLSY